MNFFGGWGLTQRFVSWVAWEEAVWLFLKVGRWDLKKKFKDLFFLWCAIGWLEKGVGIIYFVCDMVS
jgi:hypothetical protein